ncbi:hypothetical protein BGZ54_009832 [Gamsiella multidivaricata]|nr:hypothetical protein BGZ54_009832 [Gamsiella multidivaricata]
MPLSEVQQYFMFIRQSDFDSIGTGALLPKNDGPASTTTGPGRKDDDVGMSSSSEDTTPTPVPVTYYNLAVKQKTVYQPTLMHRRWMEEQKSIAPGDGIESINDIETSFASYVTELERVEAQLNEFYNGSNRFKRHKWDARRAKDAEYRLITDRLLKLVEGQIGRKREETNKVVIGVGLGKPSTKTRISSLHESFQSYFVQKVGALSPENRCYVKSFYVFIDFVLMPFRPDLWATS